MITESGFLIGNIDTTVIAEKPKLAGYIDTMKANIAGVLDIPVSKLGIKAKQMKIRCSRQRRRNCVFCICDII